jgi:hypothetical protein
MSAFPLPMYPRLPRAFPGPLSRTYPLPKNRRKTLQNPDFQPFYKPFDLI